MSYVPTLSHQQKVSHWFTGLRTEICNVFEALENAYQGPLEARSPGRFTFTDWDRPGGGGGTMGVMRGRVFEKVGVNISIVHGTFKEGFAKQLPGTEEDSSFWACGISLVAHMQSPWVPAVHMNTRHIATQTAWFGGGADLTPMMTNEEDAAFFHSKLKEACDLHDPSYYERFKEECDHYFYVRHRKEPRGAGGIFYDYLNTGDFEKDFSFTQDVGRAFLAAYPPLVERHMNRAWTPEQREHQLIKRGRYVEFNLLYDRGTAFGLQTDGNAEAILMSMPPEVKWP